MKKNIRLMKSGCRVLISTCLLLFIFLVNVMQQSKAESLSSPARIYEGKSQSPIDLKNAYELDLVDIKFLYTPSPYIVKNTGYSTRVDLQKDNFIIVDGERYKFVQFHFHTPSEHFIEGVQYPMEIHFVHQNQAGNLAVIGVLVTDGAFNSNFEKILAHIPKTRGEEKSVQEPKDILSLFPANKRVYRYTGSLTTPPFTEGVKWLVMKNTIQLSKQQIQSIFGIIGKTDREIQDLQSRPVVLDIKED